MAIIVRPDPQKFAVGSSLAAYFSPGGWRPERPSGPPAGTLVETQTIASDGTVTFNALTIGVEYVGYGSGPDRYWRFEASNSTDALTFKADKVSLKFNALAYGSIAAAVSACNTAGGGTVEIPPGVWTITAPISVPNFVSIEGHGQSTIIRCNGNFFAFNFNPGNRVGVRHLQIDSLSPQTSGGAFDYTNAVNNIRVQDIYLGINLFTGFNIKPAVVSGHFYITRVKWNGVTGCTNGILVGDGTNLVAHVVLRDLLGSANTAADMVNWMIVKNNVDTLRAHNVEFYVGTNGIAVGEIAANDVTDAKFSNCLVDFMTNTGLNVAKCRGLDWEAGQIQTCATGISLSTNCKGFKAYGGMVQNCTGSGVTVQAGASWWAFDSVMIADNNTANGAFGHGFDMVGGTSNFSIKNCQIGNNILLATGHQKYGIGITAGASDNFEISGNRLPGNETATMQYLGTGANQIIDRNLPGLIPTVASATTTTLPGTPLVVISGTTTITSVTASWAGRIVTLKFSGALTFTDGSNLLLAGNFVTTADDTITLQCDGTNWIEVARSVN